MTLSDSIRALLERGVRDGVFPGASALVLDGDETPVRLSVGHRMTTPELRPALPETLYDLASLTKPIATAASVLLLAQDGRIRLENSITDYLPEFRRADVTLRHLLTHTSGLPAWKALYLDPGDREKVIDHLGRLEPAYPVGAKIVYSCLGYILLGAMIEQVSGRTLAAFAEERLFGPLRMKETMFNPPESHRSDCAATESSNGAEKRMVNYARYDWREGVICGVVHDENAHFMGGVSGNAGLFAPMDDLGLYARFLFGNGAPIFSADTFRLLTEPAADDGETRRTLGWIVLADGALTHTGFTGTSFRWHPERRRAGILLTNRVHPDATREGIVAFRQAFYELAFA